MNFNDLLTRLTYLTKRNNLSNTEIGEVINVERRAINGRAERNSKFKDDEIKKIESKYNIDLASVSITSNSLLRENKPQIINNAADFTKRLKLLQEKNQLTDKDFSKLINIELEDFLEYKTGERKPNYNFLISIKQHFQISLDWLLFGE